MRSCNHDSKNIKLSCHNFQALWILWPIYAKPRSKTLTNRIVYLLLIYQMEDNIKIIIRAPRANLLIQVYSRFSRLKRPSKLGTRTFLFRNTMFRRDTLVKRVVFLCSKTQRLNFLIQTHFRL